MDRDGPQQTGEGQSPIAGTLAPGSGVPVADAPARPHPRWRRLPRETARAMSGRPVLAHLTLLVGYLAAGVALTWPRATYLAGSLPATRDAGGYVWGFWWIARQVTHLGNPWLTHQMAAPVGAQLGFHTLMPLPGLLLTPVTLVFSPAASYNLLSVLCPGLLGYAMYRVARLWLWQPTGAHRAGAFAAGLLFGLSPILAWRSWYEVNLAAGALFFPMALEACVRLRRRPGWRPAVILGVIMGAAMLTDQESAVMAALLVAAALLPWLVRRPSWATLRPVALATAVGFVVASPQLIAMAQQGLSGGAAAPGPILAVDYVYSGVGLEQLFAPSPRLADFGLASLTQPYYGGGPGTQVVVGYGVVLSLLTLAGIVITWRRRSGRLLAAFWVGCSVLALGSSVFIGRLHFAPLPVIWHKIRLSTVLPFTWLVHLPGLSNFREADRFTELALVPMALLAGATVAWLYRRWRPALVVVAALALLETGWAGNPPGVASGQIGTMPASMPALDGPIAADHSSSIVVDVPFGIRGGLPVVGRPFPPETMVMATADGHPLADGYISRIPDQTSAGIHAIPFYEGLLLAQGSTSPGTSAALAVDAASARRLDVGWVVDWEPANPVVTQYLQATGFRVSYRADGATVYRPAR